MATGGHSTLFEVVAPTKHVKRGETIDDAAGEAFDKVAAILGLGYPGGPIVDKLAQQGDARRFKFPRSLMAKESLDFSFSGIKTAVLYHCRGQDGRGRRTLDEQEVRDVCAAFRRGGGRRADREAVAPRRAHRRALDRCRRRRRGNRQLRERAGRSRRARRRAPPRAAQATTDNAVMVAGLGRLLFAEGVRAGLDLDATRARSRRPHEEARDPVGHLGFARVDHDRARAASPR